MKDTIEKGDRVWVNTFLYNSFEGSIEAVLYGLLGKKYLVKYTTIGLDGRNRQSADIFYWWKLIKINS